MLDQPVAVCKAGLARVCITPELPVEMAGYFHSRLATSVAHDLYASVMAVESGGHTAVIVATDLIAMTDALCMPAFERASAKFGIPVDHFMACATHTHTGPEVRHGASNPASDAVVERIAGQIAEAVDQALSTMFDAVLCVGQTRAPGLAHNRLSRCADGGEIFGRHAHPAPVIGPAGPEDDSVQTISVYDTDKRLRGIAVNFACHPDLSGGGSATAIDADWPGRTAELLRAAYGPETVCLVLQGTAGDINARDHRRDTLPWKPGGCDMVARGVAGAALLAVETDEPLAGATVACRRRMLDVPYYTRDETLFALAERLRQKGDDVTYFEKNLIQRIEGWDKDGKVDRFGVSCLRIGEVAIVGMPGEIFTAWGLEIKRYSPAKHTFVVELASSHDGLTGYKPTTDQAIRGARAKGAYGALPTLSQKHCPAAGQMMTEAAIELLGKLYE